MSHTPPTSSSFCAVCNVQCGNPTRYAQHISGRRHKQAAARSASGSGGDTVHELQPEPQAEEEAGGQASRNAGVAGAPPPLTEATAAAVVRTLSPLIAPARLQSLQQAAAQRCGAVHLAFENVVQNDNVASALRTAECAGIHHVHLIRGPQALASKRGGSLKRVDNALSKGAERWLQLYYHRDTAAFVQALRSAGIRLFGADVDASASTIADCGFGQPSSSAHVSTGRDCGCAVIFGNERDGMSPELRAACDDLFFLPSVGLTQSYNVFVSAAMAVHHLQMRSIVTPDRNEAQQQEILAGWLLRDVGRTQLEPALRQLQPSAPAMTSASGDGGFEQDDRDDPAQDVRSSPTIGDKGCSIDAEALDSLLRWARLDVRATHYGMKSDLAVQR